jgi:hypothetical protein
MQPVRRRQQAEWARKTQASDQHRPNLPVHQPNCKDAHRRSRQFVNAFGNVEGVIPVQPSVRGNTKQDLVKIVDEQQDADRGQRDVPGTSRHHIKVPAVGTPQYTTKLFAIRQLLVVPTRSLLVIPTPSAAEAEEPAVAGDQQRKEGATSRRVRFVYFRIAAPRPSSASMFSCFFSNSTPCANDRSLGTG